RQFRHYGPVSGPVGARFAIALAIVEIDIEHVYLVVAGDDVALRIEQDRPVGDTLRLDPDRERTGQQPGPGLARQGLKGFEGLVPLLPRHLLQHGAPARLHHRHALTPGDERGAGMTRPAHEAGDDLHARPVLAAPRILAAR